MESEDRRLAARTEMCARIDAMAGAAAHMPPARLAMQLDDIRRVAHLHGMIPVLGVVRAMDRALSRGEHGPMMLAWMDTLRDACDCDREDESAGEAFAAAISVRMG